MRHTVLTPTLASTWHEYLTRPKLHYQLLGPQPVGINRAAGIVRRVHDVVPPEQRIV